mmetsp:Transcript_20402/g.30347  ORF Transcript_20402/g.30347 Transcript_20402/m.30347 type:complete len:556 (-) Transcript_20402:20-1687(-)
MKLYWLVTYIYDLLLFFCVFILLIIVCLAFQLRFFTQTSPVILFLLFFGWGNAQIAFSFFLSTFFDKARSASVVGYLLVIASVLITYLLNSTIFDPTKLPLGIWLLYPPMPFFRSIFLIGIGCGLMECTQLSDLDTEPYSQITYMIIYLYCEVPIFLLLAAYFDQVLPKEYGTRAHPLFPLISVYQFFAKFCRSNSSSPPNPTHNATTFVLDAKTSSRHSSSSIIADQDKLEKVALLGTNDDFVPPTYGVGDDDASSSSQRRVENNTNLSSHHHQSCVVSSNQDDVMVLIEKEITNIVETKRAWDMYSEKTIVHYVALQLGIDSTTTHNLDGFLAFSEQYGEKIAKLFREKLYSVANSHHFAKPIEVMERVYISGYAAACCHQLLDELKISHIINLAVECRNVFPDDFQYFRADLQDNVDQDLSKVLVEIPKYVGAVLADDPEAVVLIHCLGGISRSATIMLAVLMLHNNWSLEKSLLSLREVTQGRCHPNHGFIKQLIQLESQLNITASVNNIDHFLKLMGISNKQFDKQLDKQSDKQSDKVVYPKLDMSIFYQ